MHKEVTGRCGQFPVTSCGCAALRHPDNELSGPLKGAANSRHDLLVEARADRKLDSQ